ncbi:hypothetical protein PAPYR_11125 [Paratrimastix pyriformis]|uniref:Uncharacterized protein n=1 Tax=Paratrimastix pyriformis TaxID=342808 RepID=A0ABQ8U4D5_9EUKA|nr:hypothetical protein PAPYR_11125 [Paratrimastix pyriformis]
MIKDFELVRHEEVGRGGNRNLLAEKEDQENTVRPTVVRTTGRAHRLSPSEPTICLEDSPPAQTASIVHRRRQNSPPPPSPPTAPDSEELEDFRPIRAAPRHPPLIPPPSPPAPTLEPSEDSTSLGEFKPARARAPSARPAPPPATATRPTAPPAETIPPMPDALQPPLVSVRAEGGLRLVTLQQVCSHFQSTMRTTPSFFPIPQHITGGVLDAPTPSHLRIRAIIDGPAGQLPFEQKLPLGPKDVGDIFSDAEGSWPPITAVPRGGVAQLMPPSSSGVAQSLPPPRGGAVQPGITSAPCGPGLPKNLSQAPPLPDPGLLQRYPPVPLALITPPHANWGALGTSPPPEDGSTCRCREKFSPEKGMIISK